MYNFMQFGPQICFDADSPGGDGKGGQNEKQNDINGQKMNAEITGDYGKYNRMVAEDRAAGGNGFGTGANSVAAGRGGGSGSSGAETATQKDAKAKANVDNFSSLTKGKMGRMLSAAMGKGILTGKHPGTVSFTDEEEKNIGVVDQATKAADQRNKSFSLVDLLGGDQFNEPAVVDGKAKVGTRDEVGVLTAMGSVAPVIGAGPAFAFADWIGDRPFGTIKRDTFNDATVVNKKVGGRRSDRLPYGGNTESKSGQTSTSKQAVSKSGSKAIQTTKARAKFSSLTTTDDLDDDFSLYRRMLGGYFKGASV